MPDIIKLQLMDAIIKEYPICNYDCKEHKFDYKKQPIHYFFHHYFSKLKTSPDIIKFLFEKIITITHIKYLGYYSESLQHYYIVRIDVKNFIEKINLKNVPQYTLLYCIYTNCGGFKNVKKSYEDLVLYFSNKGIRCGISGLELATDEFFECFPKAKEELTDDDINPFVIHYLGVLGTTLIQPKKEPKKKIINNVIEI